MKIIRYLARFKTTCVNFERRTLSSIPNRIFSQIVETIFVKCLFRREADFILARLRETGKRRREGKINNRAKERRVRKLPRKATFHFQQLMSTRISNASTRRRRSDLSSFVRRIQARPARLRQLFKLIQRRRARERWVLPRFTAAAG